MKTIEGYGDLAAIYESSSSIVFRTRRKQDDLPVILKLLKQDYPTTREIVRYKHEFQTIRRLAGMSGVVATYGLEKHQNTLVLVVEDFGAESLTILKGSKEFGLRECLRIGIRVAEILGEIHTANIIHKDVNPSNIVMNPETGLLKLIDFGISTALSRETPFIANPDALEGTLAYVSPEQTGRMNRSIDYRSDYYSLGATLYELSTGRLPFDTMDALEMVHCHMARQPVPPRLLDPGIPEPVSNIILKLLSKDAEERYQSASGIRSDLEACYDGLDTSDPANSFCLGSLDIPERFHIPEKLYGREKEIETLTRAVEGSGRQQTGITLVSGSAGVGKTSLVMEIHRPVTGQRGFFITGRFGQLRRNVPYSAVAEAFGDLMGKLMGESEELLSGLRENLREVLGSDAGSIVEVIPEMELIMGPQQAPPNVGGQEALKRFNRAFQRFVRVLGELGRPLVVFLDDLQWADSASLRLLELMVRDTTIRCLTVIGAYRQNEVDSAHPLSVAIQAVGREGIDINLIELRPLDLDDAVQLCSDTFHADEKSTIPLAELVVQKTGGNPFHMNEFLKTLYVEKLLDFDREIGGWRWNLEEIRARAITDNVVELMAGKIERLSDEPRRLLKWAGCLGTRFDLETLALIDERAPVETLKSLWEAAVEGLIVPAGDAWKSIELDVPEYREGTAAEFAFCHDQVQQAAYSLISPSEAPAVHRSIGLRLLAETPVDRLDQRIFDIVNQLNLATGLIDDRRERYELAHLNLRAGRKAKESAAFRVAFNYLQTGIGLLGEKSWETHYKLTLELYGEGAESAYLSTEFEETERLANVVRQHAVTPLDAVKAYEVRILALLAQNRLKGAVEVGLEILRQLGVKLPQRPTKSAILLGLGATRLALMGKSIESLGGLPEVEDPHALATMRMLSSVGLAAYLAGSDLAPLILLKLVRLTAKHGNTPVSPYAYAAYGIFLCGIVGDIDSGHRFGRLALGLLERIDSEDLRTRTSAAVNALIRHWKEHFRETLEPLHEVYQKGLEAGDWEYAALGAYAYCGYAYFAGTELAEVQLELASLSDALSTSRQEFTLNEVQILRQTILNLMGRCQDPTRLVGESYDENEMLPVHERAGDESLIHDVYCAKVVLSYLFGDYRGAVEMGESAARLAGATRWSALHPFMCFYDSLACLAMLDLVRGRQRQWKHLLRRVAANQKKMKKWAHHAPMNYLHKFYLVEAERYRLRARLHKATSLYDRAIELANEHGFVQEEALAHELAAKLYLSEGRPSIARAYMQNARYCYERWHAFGKVADLDQRYADVLAVPPAAKMQRKKAYSSIDTTSTGSEEGLDLAAAVKASQAISDEIVPRRLIEKLMRIVMEYAGAQRGFLIVEVDGTLLIEAEAEADRDTVMVLQSIPVAGSQELSLAVVNYVARTRESIVLNDSIRQGGSVEDSSYFRTRKPKSILCRPLIHQGELGGILYLENNLTAGAFTEDRLEVLGLLCSQAAISLDKARLYEHLEERVAQRTAQLAETSERLAQEAAQREQVQTALQEAHDQLELRVRERTAQLVSKNLELEEEIDRRTLVENALRASEERFRAVFESAEDFIFVKDRSLRYTHVNSAMLSALGLTISEVLGKKAEEIVGHDEAKRFEGVEQRVLEGQTVELETTLKWGDGSLDSLLVLVPLRDGSGRIDGLCGIGHDITQRRERAAPRKRISGEGAPAGPISDSTRETLEKLHRVAETDSLVLLLGESGSGKDYYARYLHDSSTRKGGPFYSINLAALPPELAESELFGHERGAFTGSRGRKRGLLELAEGGTLLLNEIGEIQVQLQAKLLRFLDTRSFTRVGGEKDISVDARLIAATNKDLKEEVEAGHFRKDLFYRLSVFVVRIPPLRERREDLPFMAGNIIESLANRMGLTRIPTIDSAAMEILADYEWPGNVRELRNVLERSLIISRKIRITEEDVRVALGPSEKMSEGEFTVGLTVSEQSSMDDAFRSATRFLVSEALDRSAGNVSAAARLLGISRDKLRHQMKALGIRRS